MYAPSRGTSLSENYINGKLYSRSACVKKKACWASEIEWPVVKHSRDKKINKGCFERVRLCIEGGQKGLAVVTGWPCQNKRVLFNFLSSGTF
jgi:hypothetical protein